jgi:TRAP-type C4-dicarboxylate transport system substrate-binding protein
VPIFASATRAIGWPVVTILLFLTNPAPAAEFTLKLGTISAANSALFADVAVPLARALERESDGRIAVDAKAQNGFGTPVEMLPMVESGAIDMAITIPSYHPGRFPRTSVLEMPTMFNAAETGARMAWTLYEEGLIAPDYKGLKVLSLFTGAPSSILVVDKTVKGLRDLRGMRIRVSSGTLGLALARLGMIPLGLPGNLLAPALANDWIDVLVYSADSARATPSVPPRSIADETPILIDYQIGGSVTMVVMNQKSFDALPKDLQAVVDRLTGAAFGVRSARVRDEAETNAKRALATDGKHLILTFSEQDRAEIAERIAPVFDDWASNLQSQNIDGPALLKRARDLAKKASS